MDKARGTYRCFDVEIADQVAHIRMNRPDEYNSMIAEFWSELPEIVDGISADASARAIVLSSTGKHFCAGMDLAVFAGGQDDADAELGRRQARLRGTVKTLQHTASCLEQARMPVLVAVQGGCIGGALDLATAADLRYCSEDAFFVVQEINIGMTADIGTLQRLGTCVPQGVARELAYTGRRMPARRAYEVGLVQQVYADHGSLVDGVLETAQEIASKSPLAMHGTKVAMNFARDHGVDESLDQMATWQAGMFQPGDMVESFTAKAEKREAKYPDLLPERSSL
ncbi:MAG: enoyl-CoA hydratase/isomerase family protein [Frankiales bacterium]|jgi:enoyl-CoA hydratase|nr:enoyl-CoA hydratase/isomerase family protein [Frankiales bacterium]